MPEEQQARLKEYKKKIIRLKSLNIYVINNDLVVL